MNAPDSSYFVAVDLGSNSFHMLIARENHGTLEVVDRVKDMVQIARGLGPDGTLSEEAQQRAFACLECFAERIRRIPHFRIRAVGTKTLRAARNAEQFLRAAEAALGHPIQIISGYEEARLVYLGVSHSIANDGRRRLVIDIGGGSTEFVIGHDYTPQCLESLSIGCVTFANRFLQAGRIDAGNMRNAYLAACEELEAIRHEYTSTGWDIAFGASGTMRVIADLMPQQTGGALITRSNLLALIEQTIVGGEVTANGVSKLRRDVLPAGLAILHAIFDQLGLKELHVADATLKEGLIYDSLGRLSQKDTRDLTVEGLFNRYRIDRSQAERVKRTALSLWREARLSGQRSIFLEKLLTWATLLHEIGLSISHSSYHRHGHYLLKNSDLGGFSRYEQQLLAALVKLHRRRLCAESLALLETGPKGLVGVLVCLRLAVLLNRGRENLAQLPHIRIEGKHVELKFDPAWLETHPLTVRSLTSEAGYLEPVGLKLQF